MKILSSKATSRPIDGTMKKAKGTKVHGISRLLNAVTNKRPLNLEHCKSDHSTSTATTQDWKFVSFAESVRVRPTASRSSYTKEEKAASFYSNEESQEMQRKSLLIVEKMEEGDPIFLSKYCTRGLEKHTRVTGRMRLRNRFDAMLAVLNEQERQRIDGVFDDESIAKVYAVVTSSCQLWAHRVGLCDQREAARYID